RDRGTSADDMGSALRQVDLGHEQVVVELGCGSRHCCARFIQNTMKCWGANTHGQLGLGDLVAVASVIPSNGKVRARNQRSKKSFIRLFPIPSSTIAWSFSATTDSFE